VPLGVLGLDELVVRLEGREARRLLAVAVVPAEVLLELLEEAGHA